MNEFLQGLKDRKLVQWALAYAATAWLLLQVLSLVASSFEWPALAMRAAVIAAVTGFPIALVLAWYHGERGAQRFTGTELMIVAFLLAVGAVVVWRLAPKPAETGGAPTKTSAAMFVADRKSIAVLPFANLSRDADNAYFADGMRDMILTKLATIGELKVISRTSTDKYGNHPEDLKKVAMQLGVASVLEGSVQKSGNQVLINLQLISADNDQHLWAEAYKRTVDDIFGVEGEIAQIVAETLNAKLSNAEQKSVADKPTTNAEAFDLFLRAEHVRHEGESGKRNALVEAIALYEQAVAKDPKFALAWAQMSSARANRYWAGEVEKGQLPELARLVQQNAEQALALQPGLSEAHVAMGFYYYYVRLDFAQALVSFEAALRAKPNDAHVLYDLGLITRRLRRFDEALDHFKAANRLDPRNRLFSGELIVMLVYTRRYSATAQFCERELALDPTNMRALIVGAAMKIVLHDDLEGAQVQLRAGPPAAQVERADVLAWLKRYDEAIALAESIPDTPDNFGKLKSQVLGTLYVESGNAAAARPLLLDARKKIVAADAELPDDYPGAAESRLQVALLDALLGENDAAVKLAQHALTLPTTLPDKDYFGWIDVANVAMRVYARAQRADLAVPLLAKLLASPATGFALSYSDLRWDPDFDPIREDPAFQALVKAHPGSGDVPE
jgi:TolB-like protein/Tfp pilus assembly protein PilF